MIKDFVVFVGAEPARGGWWDFKASFDTFEEAKAHALTIQPAGGWWMVMNTRTGHGESSPRVFREWVEKPRPEIEHHD